MRPRSNAGGPDAAPVECSETRAAGGGGLAQEGAFGTHLLETDVAIPPLMFGPADMLNADAHALSTQVGWGLTLRRDRDFAALVSR